MRKKNLGAILVGTAMLFSVSLAAQERKSETNTEESIRLGVKGSFNISTFNNVKNGKVKNPTLGFSAGLFAKLPLMHRFAIQPELYYAGKGATVTYNNLFIAGSVQYKLSYLELPVLLVYNITPNFSIHAGPYGGILLYSDVQNKPAVQVFDFEHAINKENFKHVEGGLAAGFGLDLGAMGIGLRLYQGLTKVGKERSYVGYNYTFPDAMNTAFSAYLNFSVN